MILFPNAKINLGLDILRKRPDGYHDIDTVMLPIDWCDVLEVLPAKELTLTVTGRAVDCPMEKNLVIKAYRLLQQSFDIPPVEIHLHKNIPDGAGLGGGSSDAAFMLMALNRLFDLELDNQVLIEFASRLGADCAFFIENRPMRCTGTGTQLSPVFLHLNNTQIVVVKPKNSISTAEAYSSVCPSIPLVALPERLARDVYSWQTNIVNDFECSVGGKLPQILDIKKRLLQAGAYYASMSGSGSAVYGLFESDKMAADMQSLFIDCIVHSGAMITGER